MTLNYRTLMTTITAVGIGLALGWGLGTQPIKAQDAKAPAKNWKSTDEYNLYDAFSKAKDHAWEKIRYSGTLRYMLPWLPDDIEEIDELFGGDCWPYGVEPNRPTLEALVTYMVEQGLIPEPIPIEKLFVPTFG